MTRTPGSGTPALDPNEGGIPAVPVLVTATNVAIGTASAIVLVGGAPVAAGVGGAVAVVYAVGKAAKATRRTRSGARSVRRTSSVRRSAPARKAAPARSGSASAKKTAPARKRTTSKLAPAPVRKAAAMAAKPVRKAGAVKAARKAAAARHPTRTARRAAQVQARRKMADTRARVRRNHPGRGRQALSAARKAVRRTPRSTPPKKTVQARTRPRLDRRTQSARDRIAQRRRLGQANRTRKRALRKNKAGEFGPIVLAFALAHLGFHTMAGHILAKAAAKKALLDKTAQDQYDDTVTDPKKISPKVQRAPRPAPVKGSIMADGQKSQFDFAERCEDLKTEAQQYDPDGAMDVKALIDSFPDALTDFKEVFKILAEKADQEMPFDKQVGEALGDIYDALETAVQAAESAKEKFAKVHEADIERHESPRNGPQAEAKWDIGNN